MLLMLLAEGMAVLEVSLYMVFSIFIGIFED